jgi:hypothetical protein
MTRLLELLSALLDKIVSEDDEDWTILDELFSDEDVSTGFVSLLLDSTGLSELEELSILVELEESSFFFELDDSTFLELEDTSFLLLLDSTLPELEDSLFLVELEEASVELDDSTFLELEDFSSLALLLEIASSFSLDEDTSVSMPVSSFLEGPLELSSPQATKPSASIAPKAKNSL